MTAVYDLKTRNKGKSRFRLNVPIIASDVKNWNLPAELVGITVEFTPQALALITGLSKNVIVSRLQAEEKTLLAGKVGRGIRQVAGLDPFERRVGEQPKAKKMGEKAKERLVNRMFLAW